MGVCQNGELIEKYVRVKWGGRKYMSHDGMKGAGWGGGGQGTGGISSVKGRAGRCGSKGAGVGVGVCGVKSGEENRWFRCNRKILGSKRYTLRR